MDPVGNIYPIPDDEHDEKELAQLREDIGRLDGYLRGRAEADAGKREKALAELMAEKQKRKPR